ncbi:MAG: CPBP family intramembrane metalloprotease [Candidatus Bipolaricaulota bacterium]|nr:CPBP family intramembrane metalloprotease [Candidatus Bipolaricaulota bacterium]MCS7274368.1 CPBP family intramembrane metalloprotease [Candidatus Bipolaricaulota bacterium]MDW8111567.1 type II CAAX endopeptidase family protein [Candidatus Bipolaricaulota bacterium]MDW8329788.1 type II CAAX endopeptidase family protein [Candidatus Bipolaricaulota bacterium]
MSAHRPLAPIVMAIVAAFALWYFAFQTEVWNFWLRLSLAVALLAGFALWQMPERASLFRFEAKDLLWGVLSALVLYMLFWLGKSVATALLPFASEQISSVYANKAQAELWLIGLLLVVVLGPGEEIFWRALVQRRLCERLGDLAGWLVATAVYALVHVWTLNLMLVGAAAVAGLVWGGIYLYRKNLVTVIVSHALWDLAIFVIWPLG